MLCVFRLCVSFHYCASFRSESEESQYEVFSRVFFVGNLGNFQIFQSFQKRDALASPRHDAATAALQGGFGVAEFGRVVCNLCAICVQLRAVLPLLCVIPSASEESQVWIFSFFFFAENAENFRYFCSFQRDALALPRHDAAAAALRGILTLLSSCA